MIDTSCRHLLLLAVLASVAWTGVAWGSSARLVTFGSEAPPGKGDDDFTEEIHIRVPEDAPDQLYLRIFDPDVGGVEDEPSGHWNTRTRFALFGAVGDATSGRADGLLAERVFGVDPTTDGLWYTFARIAPGQGRAVDGARVFRLLVQGLEGDDGNLFDIAISTEPDANSPVAGAVLLAERPTISVPPGRERFAEARFEIPAATTAIRIRNFDLDGARIALEMPFVGRQDLDPSGDADWREQVVALEPDQSARPAAILVQGGRRLLNDIVLEVLDQDGRRLPFQLPVRMEPSANAPVPQIGYDLLADCRSVAFDASASDGAGNVITEYRWDFGDGNLGSGERVRHAYARPGTYPVVLKVIDDSGRVLDRARTAIEVKINHAPEAVPGPSRTAAPEERLRFDAAASSDPDGRIIGYVWDFGDGQGATGIAVEHTYAEPGRYRVSLVVEDDGPGPCTRAEGFTEIWVNAAPQAEAGPDQAASVGQRLQFDAGGSRDDDGQIVRYAWDFGDGAQADGQVVEHHYAAPGRYQVTLRVADDAGVGNSGAEDRLGVWVNDPPVALIKAARRGAIGELLRFDATGSSDPDGELSEYHWDFGDGTQGLGAEVTHAYQRPGVYVVKLRVRDDSATDSATDESELSLIINDPPVADAGPDQWVTASKVRFDGSGSHDPDGQIRSWLWDFGDGARGEGPTPSHVYALPGDYRVVLSVTDDSGTASATVRDEMLVRINAAPVADAGPDQLAAPGQVITFDGSGSLDPDGTVVEYLWDFGDGTLASGARVSHTYAQPGRYGVDLEVRDDSGHPKAFGSADARVLVNAAPVAVAGPDRLVAPGQAFELDAGGSYDPDGRVVSHQWRFSDDSAPLDGAEVNLTLAEPGVVTATLEVTDDSGAVNGQARDEVTIRVNHPPTAVLEGLVQGCETLVTLDGRASHDPDGDRLGFTWDFGDGSAPGQGATPRHRFAQGGRYPVTLLVDDGTGLDNATDTAASEVWIHRSPIAIAEAPALACAGEVVLFNGSRSSDPDGGALLYVWDFGDGTGAQEASPVKNYPRGGHYAVTLSVRDDSALACNQARDRIAVTVADAPVAVAGEDLSVCAGAPVRFDGSASRDFDGVVNSYQWDFGDGSQGGGAQPTHIYTGAGTYLAKLVITGDQVGECDNRNSDTLRVEVLDAPRIAIQGPAQIALETEIALAAIPTDAGALSVGLAYRWDFGDGQSGEGIEVAHRYQEPGRYQVRLTVDDGRDGACSRAERVHSLLVNAPPRAVGGADREVAVGERLILDGSDSLDPDGVIARYQWDFGDGEQAEGVEVAHRYAEPGIYVAELRVTDNTDLANNQDRDEVRVRVNAAPIPVIAWTPEVPCAGEQIAFDGRGSQDPDGILTRWTWAFGDADETQADGDQVTHAFERPGRHGVALRVTDDRDVSNSSATRLSEIQVNRPPVARIAGPIKGCPGQPIGFDASGSLDPDGTIETYRWSFGDDSQGGGPTPSHVYDAPGRYPVMLSVTDDSGSACAAGEARAQAAINGAPIAKIGVSSRISYLEGTHDAIRFDASGSTDPDGDPLIHAWDFGDGHTGRGSKVTHAFTEPGRHRVRLTSRDDSGTGCAQGVDEVEIRIERSRGLR